MGPGGYEQGTGPEGLPGQLRGWTMQLPSTRKSDLVQPPLRKTLGQTLRCLRPCESHLPAPPACRQPVGLSPQSTQISSRDPFPGQNSICHPAHHAQTSQPLYRGQSPDGNQRTTLPGTWKAAGKHLLLGLQGPPDALGDHGWKRREGNHVQEAVSGQWP